MRRLSVMMSVAVLGLATMLAGCNLPGQSTSAGASGTSSTTTSPTAVATPTLPTGDYAFLRNGDIWAYTGGAPSHAITQLHLSATSALWGAIVWSADHKTLAFTLNTPSFAPGYPANGQPAHFPAQNTGSLFTVDVASGKLTAISGSGGAVPLLGQHEAWYTSSGNVTNLLFTRAGLVDEIQPGAANASAAVLAGPQSVWEIAVRGNTLFYSSVINISSTGSGFAQLRAFDLVAKKDRLVAVLGPVTLPPSPICSGLICVPDKSTPAVPYPWAVSADGSVIVYAQGPQASGPVPRPSKTPTAAPAPTATPASGQITGFFAVTGTGKPQQIFKAITLPTTETQFRLGLSPDGQHVALGVGDLTNAPFGPYVQAVTNGTAQNVGSSGAIASGTPAWSPDNLGFVLTTVPSLPTPSSPQTPSLTVYYPNSSPNSSPSGQSAQLELNGADLAWGM